MNTVETTRTFDEPPHRVWPVISNPERWLEPDVRWQVDEKRSVPDETFIARFWSTPSESTEVVITLEPSEVGGTEVTVRETRDRLGPQALRRPAASLAGSR